jgi:hypothetical protein
VSCDTASVEYKIERKISFLVNNLLLHGNEDLREHYSTGLIKSIFDFCEALLTAAKPFLSYLNSGAGEPSGSGGISVTEAVHPSGSQEISFTELRKESP